MAYVSDRRKQVLGKTDNTSKEYVSERRKSIMKEIEQDKPIKLGLPVQPAEKHSETLPEFKAKPPITADPYAQYKPKPSNTEAVQRAVTDIDKVVAEHNNKNKSAPPPRNAIDVANDFMSKLQIGKNNLSAPPSQPPLVMKGSDVPRANFAPDEAYRGSKPKAISINEPSAPPQTTPKDWGKPSTPPPIAPDFLKSAITPQELDKRQVENATAARDTAIYHGTNLLNSPKQFLTNIAGTANRAIYGKPLDIMGNKDFYKDVLPTSVSQGIDNLEAKNPVLGGGVKFAIDVANDPLTWVGGGVFDDLAKAGKVGKAAVKGTTESLNVAAEAGERAAKKAGKLADQDVTSIALKQAYDKITGRTGKRVSDLTPDALNRAQQELGIDLQALLDDYEKAHTVAKQTPANVTDNVTKNITDNTITDTNITAKPEAMPATPQSATNDFANVGNTVQPSAEEVVKKPAMRLKEGTVIPKKTAKGTPDVADTNVGNMGDTLPQEAAKHNEVITIVRGNNKFEVYKNPTDDQYYSLVDKFKAEYPHAPVGEPKVRKTYDKDGNEYVWMSGDAMHYDIENYLKKNRNIEANQNKFFDTVDNVAPTQPVTPPIAKPEASPAMGETLPSAANAEAVNTTTPEVTPEVPDKWAASGAETKTSPIIEQKYQPDHIVMEDAIKKAESGEKLTPTEAEILYKYYKKQTGPTDFFRVYKLSPKEEAITEKALMQQYGFDIKGHYEQRVKSAQSFGTKKIIEWPESPDFEKLDNATPASEITPAQGKAEAVNTTTRLTKGEKFKKGKYNINTSDGVVEVNGDTYKGLGINKAKTASGNFAGYTVTHINSGFKVTDFKTKAEAEAYAKYIADNADATKPADIFTPELKKIHNEALGKANAIKAANDPAFWNTVRHEVMLEHGSTPTTMRDLKNDILNGTVDISNLPSKKKIMDALGMTESTPKTESAQLVTANVSEAPSKYPESTIDKQASLADTVLEQVMPAQTKTETATLNEVVTKPKNKLRPSRLEDMKATLPDTADELTAKISELQAMRKAAKTNKERMAINLQLFAAETKLRQIKTSKFYTNTAKKSMAPEDYANLDPRSFEYHVQTHGDTSAKAEKNLAEDYERVKEKLMSGDDEMTAEDIKAADTILEDIARKAKETNDPLDVARYNEFSASIAARGRRMGQGVEAFKQWRKNTPEGFIVDKQGEIIDAQEAILKQNPAKKTKIKEETDGLKKDLQKTDKAASDKIADDINKELQKPAESKPAGNKPTESKTKGDKTDGKPQTDEEQVMPEDMLADRVISYVADPKVPEEDPVKDMVNELFRVAKESPIERVKVKGKSATEFIKQAFENRQDFMETWKKAKDIVEKKYADKPDKLAMLEDYFSNKARPPVSDRTLSVALKDAMKALNVDWGKTVQRYYAEGQQTKQALTDYIIKETGLDGDNAKSLANYISTKLNDLTKAEKERILSAYVKPKQVGSNANNVNAIEKLSNVGAFENEKYVADVLKKVDAETRALIKDSGVDINELARQEIDSIKLAEQKLTKEISEKLNINDKDLKRVLDEVNKQFSDLVNSKQMQKIKAELRIGVKNNDVAAVNSLIEKTNLGLVDKLSPDITKLFKENNIDINKLVHETLSQREFARVKLLEDMSKTLNVNDNNMWQILTAIDDEFTSRVKFRQEQILSNMAKSFTKPTPKSEFDRVLDMINLGVYDNKELGDIIKQKYGLPVLTNDDIKTIDQLMQMAQKVPEGQYNPFRAKAQQLMENKLPVGLIGKYRVLQRLSLILFPKSLITRNIVSNIFHMSLAQISEQTSGVLTDILTTAMRKGYFKYVAKDAEKAAKVTRTTMFMPIEKTKAMARGVGKGLNEWGLDIKYNVDTNPTHGQLELGHSNQVFKGKNVVTKALSNVVNTLDVWEKRILQLGDRPFYESAKNIRMAELKKIYKNTPMTEELKQQIESQSRAYGLDMVFQRNSSFSKIASGFKNAANGTAGEIPFQLAVNAVLPFTQTPANVLDKMFSYSPLGLSKVVKELAQSGKEFNQKAFVDALSRTLTGSGIIALGIGLASKGLITGKQPKSPKAREFNKAIGDKPYSINLGDGTYTYDWSQPAGALLAIGADAYQSGKSKADIGSLISEAAIAGGDTFFRLSFMNNFSQAFQGDSPARSMVNLAMGTTTQAIPTLSKGVAQLVDKSQRLTYDDNLLETTLNKLKTRIPWVSTTLPVDYDALGNPVEVYDGKNNVFNVMFNPGFYSEKSTDPVALELKRVYEATDNTDALPTVLEPKLTVNGKNINLTGELLSKYRKRLGEVTRDRLHNYMFGEWANTYNGYTNDQKAKAISTTVSNAREMVKNEIYQYVKNNQPELMADKK